MKRITPSCIRAIVAASLLTMAGLAQAQTDTTTSQTSTTTSAGTISTYSPDVMTVRTETSSTPVSYSFSKTTTYVDENGNPVSVDVVRSGVPVTVYYTQDGDRMVASKVVVRKIVSTDTPAPAVIEKKATTTTTSSSNQ
jgi:hypothetical protein